MMPTVPLASLWYYTLLCFLGLTRRQTVFRPLALRLANGTPVPLEQCITVLLLGLDLCEDMLDYFKKRAEVDSWYVAKSEALSKV
jgi:hypothetical protein